jgi:hypothetical protein
MLPLNRGFNELKNDPSCFIYEYFAEISRQVDIRRETLFDDINQFSNKLIKKIEKLKEECMSKKTKNDTIGAIESQLDQLNSTVSSFDIDDFKLEDDMSKKASKEIDRLKLTQLALKQYKLDLRGGQCYKLVIRDIKLCLENMFGSLVSFDYDLENIKVNIA